MQTHHVAAGATTRAHAPRRPRRPARPAALRPPAPRDALTLSVETLGSGPPLAVLHGLYGAGSNWRGIAQRLAESHTVHLIDLRNHGASPWAESMDYLQMADDVEHTLRQLEEGPVDLLGHSMGGKTAMAVALRHPARVHRLVVVDIAPVAYADRFGPYLQALQAPQLLAAVTRSEVERRLAALRPDTALAPFFLQGLAAHNDHFDWRVNVAAVSASAAALADFPDVLRGLQFPRPALVVAGDHSDYITPSDLRHFAPRFPAYRLVSLAGAGHWVHADQPLAFTDAVLRFLAEAPAHD